MYQVSYEYRFEYTHDPDGKQFPRLEIRITSAETATEAVDVWAYLDSGAERSLFNGWIGATLGIDLLAGRQITYETGSGAPLFAALHPIRIFHPDLGDFDLEVGLSLSEIPRNLLGRDFFDRVQIGFREHHLAFFLSPNP